MLGELETTAGRVLISPDCQDSTAYVSQQPWIQNMTIKDNILFGKAFEQGWYDEVHLGTQKIKSGLIALDTRSPLPFFNN